MGWIVVLFMEYLGDGWLVVLWFKWGSVLFGDEGDGGVNYGTYLTSLPDILIGGQWRDLRCYVQYSVHFGKSFKLKRNAKSAK